MKHPIIQLKLLLVLVPVFILMTIIGTLSHELGHYTMARIRGHQAKINYQSTSHRDTIHEKILLDIYTNCEKEINSDVDFPGREIYEKYLSDTIWILMAGPMQTMLFGTLGFLCLWYNRKRFIKEEKVHWMGWSFVFLSLFWLRQVANLLMGIPYYFRYGILPQAGDEVRLANLLDLNMWSIQLSTGLIGMGILLVIVLWLPKRIRVTFLAAGLIGGVLGYYLWLVKFGPLIMP